MLRPGETMCEVCKKTISFCPNDVPPERCPDCRTKTIPLKFGEKPIQVFSPVVDINHFKASYFEGKKEQRKRQWTKPEPVKKDEPKEADKSDTV